MKDIGVGFVFILVILLVDNDLVYFNVSFGLKLI